ncbi:transposase [Streptomyces sp. NPDC048594]|uniref:transposase n=1 Tax=Streptomyces sp. NPDC048594 TaxID=3365575 RepID=UPI00371B5030
MPDRQASYGILFALHTGIQWEYLPQDLGLGSGMTCRRRSAAWNEAGVRDQLHLILSARPRAAKRLDRSRAGSMPAACGPLGAAPRRSQPGRPRNDVIQLLPLLAQIPLGSRARRQAAPTARHPPR